MYTPSPTLGIDFRHARTKPRTRSERGDVPMCLVALHLRPPETYVTADRRAPDPPSERRSEGSRRLEVTPAR
jgi:hypothetical protein